MIPFGVAMDIYKIVQAKSKIPSCFRRDEKVFNKALTENLKGKANSNKIRFFSLNYKQLSSIKMVTNMNKDKGYSTMTLLVEYHKLKKIIKFQSIKYYCKTHVAEGVLEEHLSPEQSAKHVECFASLSRPLVLSSVLYSFPSSSCSDLGI